MKKTPQSGFTIVELLIVIVIIGILAVLVVVTYNGIQNRARYASMKNDVNAYEKLIKLYYADNGQYPCPVAAGTTYITGPTPSIPGLVPQYTSKLPTIPNDGKGGYYAYICTTNGGEFKFVRLSTSAPNLPQVEQSDPNPDATRPGRGWGIWSSGGQTL